MLQYFDLFSFICSFAFLSLFIYFCLFVVLSLFHAHTENKNWKHQHQFIPSLSVDFLLFLLLLLNAYVDRYHLRYQCKSDNRNVAYIFIFCFNSSIHSLEQQYVYLNTHTIILSGKKMFVFCYIVDAHLVLFDGISKWCKQNALSSIACWSISFMICM